MLFMSPKVDYKPEIFGKKFFRNLICKIQMKNSSRKKLKISKNEL